MRPPRGGGSSSPVPLATRVPLTPTVVHATLALSCSLVRHELVGDLGSRSLHAEYASSGAAVSSYGMQTRIRSPQPAAHSMASVHWGR